VQKFDFAVDRGWVPFLTKPIFWLLDWLFGAVGNFGIAILILTVIVKALFFPLANKSYTAMSKMKRLTPQMQALRERLGDDKVKLNQEMMALYKREKVNPAAGCLPIFVQIPVFFALYKVLFVTIEMRHAPFYGWIKDLSAPDPTTVLNLFGLLPYSIPDLGFFNILSIGVWPIIMGVTMFLQQKINPPPPDPVQARMFMMLPFVFTFMLGQFAAGLVIYWAWNNLLSIAQQWVIMRRVNAQADSVARS
jgi:YidC/Oxa1 family membrane protein insertase